MSAVAGRPLVLTLRASGLGDLLTAVPALRAVRRHVPEAHHLLACPAPLAGLAQATEAVDEVTPTAGLDDRAARLPRGAAVAVNLHGRGPESHRLLLGTAPCQLLAFHHPDVGATGPRGARTPWRRDEHEVHRWCRLLGEHGIDADPADLHVRVDPRSWRRFAGCTVLHTGAASAARRWPAPDWIAVGRALREQGHRLVFTGSRAERLRCERIARGVGAPPAAVLAGSTDAVDLVALAQVARLVVSGDTGMAHVATATATPSVVLFGPTSPERWGPPAGAGCHVALWAGRSGDPHGCTPDPGLLELRPADVLAAVTTLDATSPGDPPREPPVPASL